MKTRMKAKVSAIHFLFSVYNQQIDQNVDLSELILDLLERAFQIFGAELDDEKITGETISLPANTNQDMIPSLLQIAESIVFGVDGSQNDSVSQIRHKVLDRLLSIYLM